MYGYRLELAVHRSVAISLRDQHSRRTHPGFGQLTNKSEWSDIDQVLCRLSDQSTGAAHPLRVNVHMAHPERYGGGDLEKLEDYLKEAWPLFWEKGEVFLTSYVSIVDLSGARLVGGGR